MATHLRFPQSAKTIPRDQIGQSKDYYNLETSRVHRPRVINDCFIGVSRKQQIIITVGST